MEENYNNEQQNTYEYNTNYNYTPSQNYDPQDNHVMSVGQWLLVILATMIPCVGLILYLVWAFSNGGNQNRKNYCRAWLIYFVIQTVLGLIIGAVLSASLMPAIINSYY